MAEQQRKGVACPECGRVALIELRESVVVDGRTFDRVKLTCEAGHSFFITCGGAKPVQEKKP